MLTYLPGYYLVHLQCLELLICCPRTPLSKRLSNARQLTQNGSSLLWYPFTSLLMPNKQNLQGRSIKQNTQVSWSRAAIATSWCILHALPFAWRLFGAHRMLKTRICLSAKTIVETTQQRTAIDTKLIITVLPLFKPTDDK